MTRRWLATSSCSSLSVCVSCRGSGESPTISRHLCRKLSSSTLKGLSSGWATRCMSYEARRDSIFENQLVGDPCSGRLCDSDFRSEHAAASHTKDSASRFHRWDSRSNGTHNARELCTPPYFSGTLCGCLHDNSQILENLSEGEPRCDVRNAELPSTSGHQPISDLHGRPTCRGGSRILWIRSLGFPDIPRSMQKKSYFGVSASTATSCLRRRHRIGVLPASWRLRP